MRQTFIHEIIEAKIVHGTVVEFVFDDLKRAKIDLKDYLGRGLFKDLVQAKNFQRFKVDAELGTICWPNGADIAPEVLYQVAFGAKA